MLEERDELLIYYVTITLWFNWASFYGHFLDSPERLLQKALGLDLDNGKQNPINKNVNIKFTCIFSQHSKREWEDGRTRAI